MTTVQDARDEFGSSCRVVVPSIPGWQCLLRCMCAFPTKYFHRKRCKASALKINRPWQRQCHRSPHIVHLGASPPHPHVNPYRTPSSTPSCRYRPHLLPGATLAHQTMCPTCVFPHSKEICAIKDELATLERQARTLHVSHHVCNNKHTQYRLLT